MSVRRLAWLAVACLALAAACMGLAQAAAAQVHASFDRDHAALGDTVTLNVKVQGATRLTPPDTNALSQDFQVLGTSRSTSISIINGRRQDSVTWSVALKPLHAGTLTVPPLQIDGQTTQALTLTVSPPSPQGQGHAGDPVFVEATPSSTQPYVGQQIDLTVRLFFQPSLSDGSLDKPSAKGLQVRRLGSDDQYQISRDGQSYHVVERHYALIAQKAGRMDIPGIGFSGTALDPNGFASFMGGGQAVQARSPGHRAQCACAAGLGQGQHLASGALGEPVAAGLALQRQGAGGRAVDVDPDRTGQWAAI